MRGKSFASLSPDFILFFILPLFYQENPWGLKTSFQGRPGQLAAHVTKLQFQLVLLLLLLLFFLHDCDINYKGWATFQSNSLHYWGEIMCAPF